MITKVKRNNQVVGYTKPSYIEYAVIFGNLNQVHNQTAEHSRGYPCSRQEDLGECIKMMQEKNRRVLFGGI